MVTPDEPPGERRDARARRADCARRAGRAARRDVNVGGATAQDQDFTDLISGSLWKVALFVVLFSYLVLLLVLRAVVLPLKAVLMNLLSVGAAYGVLVMVFQWGWFDCVIGFESLGYVQALTPALLLAVVFGLSMDYEVFMLSRIKERYNATGDNRPAVAAGLARRAKTISSAALIMVAVFADLRRHGRAAGQGDRRRPGRRDLPRRDRRPARPRPDDDGADGRLELVGAEVAGPAPARHGLRVVSHPNRKRL